MSPVAIAAKTKASPHMASAGMLRCCSHDSSSNPPATAKVNPVIIESLTHVYAGGVNFRVMRHKDRVRVFLNEGVGSAAWAMCSGKNPHHAPEKRGRGVSPI